MDNEEREIQHIKIVLGAVGLLAGVVVIAFLAFQTFLLKGIKINQQIQIRDQQRILGVMEGME